MAIYENTRSHRRTRKHKERKHSRCVAVTRKGTSCKRRCPDEFCYQHQVTQMLAEAVIIRDEITEMEASLNLKIQNLKDIVTKLNEIQSESETSESETSESESVESKTSESESVESKTSESESVKEIKSLGIVGIVGKSVCFLMYLSFRILVRILILIMILVCIIGLNSLNSHTTITDFGNETLFIEY